MDTIRQAECVLLTPGAEPGHSVSTLNRSVQQGALLRLRPGVFVDREEWVSLPSWIQHRAAAAAVALGASTAILCRETALAMYGVPLLRVPREVHLRTLSRGMVGRSGELIPRSGSRRTFPVRRIGPPVPRGTTSEKGRNAYTAGEGGSHRIQIEIPDVRLTNGSLARGTVEPLPFVLMDTLPRCSFEAGIVALDGVLAGRYGYQKRVEGGHLGAVQGWLWSIEAQSQWQSMLRFADPRSESPGESRSRVIIDQLGFTMPELQTALRLRSGGLRRLDFDWDADGVIGEFDGELKYRSEDTEQGTSVYWEEKWREDEIEELTGKRFVRWRWDDLNDPLRLERKLLLKGVSKRAPRLCGSGL